MRHHWIETVVSEVASILIQERITQTELTPAQKDEFRKILLERSRILTDKTNRKPILFLFVDVDGCLNNSESPDWETKSNNMVLDQTNLENYFALISFLCGLFRLTIVLSSGWKIYPKHLDYLKQNGLHWDDITPTKLTSTRSDEIRMWLRDELTLPDGFDVMELDNFLVLDDELYLPDWGDKLINCNFQKGGFTKQLLEQTQSMIVKKLI